MSPLRVTMKTQKTTEVKGPASFLKRALWVLQHYEHIVFTCFMKGERTCKSFSQLVVDDNKLFFEAELKKKEKKEKKKRCLKQDILIISLDANCNW